MIAYFVHAGPATSRYFSYAVIASASLRRVHPAVQQWLVCSEDSRADAKLFGVASSQFDKVVALPTPKGSDVLVSRYLKVTAPAVLSERSLFIDTDTLTLKPFLGDLPTRSLAAALDRNGVVPPGTRAPAVLALWERLGWPALEHPYFNTGVVHWPGGKGNEVLSAAWQRRWQQCVDIGVNQDQPAFNQAITDVGLDVSVLAPHLNAMVGVDPSSISRARIAHFYSSLRSGGSQSVLDSMCEGWESTGVIDWGVLDDSLQKGTLWLGVSQEAARAGASRALVSHAWRAISDGQYAQAAWLAREAVRQDYLNEEAWAMVVRALAKRVTNLGH